ncbi:MAG: carbon-nitrogen hydrolase family protein [Methylobacter sp.]|nr:MAG: carbon-nitrogen hydrolase family protein [Methylobacter sp.]
MDSLSPQTVSLESETHTTVRVLVGQPAWEASDWDQPNQLYGLANIDRATAWLNSFLEKARETKCNIVVLPELSVPESLIPIIVAWSSQTNALVIGGSHYVQTSSGYISRSPIISSGKQHYVEKIHPAPAEVSPQKGDGLISGKIVTKFTNTPIGTFGVLICSDYLKDDVKSLLPLGELDALFVISFQRDSRKYYKRIDIDVEDHAHGVYVFYANNVLEGGADGRSALFGLTDMLYTDQLASQLGTPEMVPQPLVNLGPKDDFFIVDVDTINRRPATPRTVDTRPNVVLVERGACFAQLPKGVIRNSFVPPDFLGSQMQSTEDRIQAHCRKQIAKHGLNDEEWVKALSSMYFLVALAHDLRLTDTDEYGLLLDNFLSHFRFKHNDTIDLLDDKVLVTPEENQHIRVAMEEEDRSDPYFTATQKTRASSVNMALMHRNYLYGVALGIASRHNSRLMRTIRDSTIQHLIYGRNPTTTDSAGGWHPYRVPWVTARILVSLGLADLSDRPDVTGIDEVIDSGLKSLVTRLDPEGFWRSGVGLWVSNWECTALCLEAFLISDRRKTYRPIIDAVVGHVLARRDEWLSNDPNFLSEESANESLASALVASVVLRLGRSYTLSETLVPLNIRNDLLGYLQNCLEEIEGHHRLSPRQFCTVPQLIAYCASATKD